MKRWLWNEMTSISYCDTHMLGIGVAHLPKFIDMLKNTHTNFWHTCRSFLLRPLPNSTWSITGNCKWQKIRTHAFDIVVFGSFVRPPLLNSTWLKRNGKLQVTKVYHSIDPWVCKFWKCCSYFGLYTHLPLLRVRVWVIWDGHCSYGLVWLVLCHLANLLP